MVIFQYNLYIFGIHLRTVLYPKPCYNEPCYKDVEVYPDTYTVYVPVCVTLCFFRVESSANLLSQSGESQTNGFSPEIVKSIAPDKLGYEIFLLYMCIH